MADNRIYHVEVYDFGNLYFEWNRHFDFDDFEKAIAYCKELNFQGHEFELTAYNKSGKIVIEDDEESEG